MSIYSTYISTYNNKKYFPPSVALRLNRVHSSRTRRCLVASPFSVPFVTWRSVSLLSYFAFGGNNTHSLSSHSRREYIFAPTLIYRSYRRLQEGRGCEEIVGMVVGRRSGEGGYQDAASGSNACPFRLSPAQRAQQCAGMQPSSCQRRPTVVAVRQA